ncbi:Uncharacterized protein HZ326_31843 [Fusarium oxysporum f. sp. albedinis]|nr:Uncharacterized protein HZ326_31843 [Fusarium oxysporum f. sp. albedinis]
MKLTLSTGAESVRLVTAIHVVQKARSHPLILDWESATFLVQKVRNRQIRTDTWLRWPSSMISLASDSSSGCVWGR